MTRVHLVNRSRKASVCSKCGGILPVGSAYRHASPGFRGRKIVRCMKPECSFRQSDLTTSKMSSAYAAIESAEDILSNGMGSLDDIRSTLQQAADEIRDVAQEYRDANHAWGETNGAENYEWVEKADELEGFADELENWEPSEEHDESAWSGEDDTTPGWDTSDDYISEMIEEALTALGEASF